MSKFKFKLNSRGVRELLKSEKMQAHLSKKASGIKDRCGEGYETDTHVGKNRANAMIYTTTYQAKSDNKKNNTLLKAVRG